MPHWFWFCLLLSVALVLAGGSFVIGAYTADAQPDTVVRAYFAALQRGDAAAALGYGTIPSGPAGLLSSTVLAEQNTIGPIIDFDVVHVSESGDTARVGVTYTVDLQSGPVTVPDVVPVVRSGHGWRLAEAAVPVTVYPGSGSDLASVGGARIPDGTFPMFPGAVPVTYDSPDLTLAPGARVVRFADDLTILRVDATVTPAAEATIQPAVTRALAACLAGTSATEELCPLPDEAAGVPGSLRGRVTGPVRLTFRVGSVGGQINIGGSAPVAGVYQELDENNVGAVRRVRSTGLSAFVFVSRPGVVWWGGGS